MEIEDIPKKYGGQLDFECGMMPVLDPQIRQCIDIKGGAEGQALFLSAPVRWIEAGEDGEMTALGVGSIGGKQRNEPVATLHSIAVRVASHSKNFQSQRTQIVVPNSRPETPRSQAPSSTSRPVSVAASKVAAPVGHTSTQPAPFTNIGPEHVHRHPGYVANAPDRPMQNGGPPEKISLPPAPVQIERTQTDFFTPPSDPSEMKRLE